jgi:hypothetical protein
MRFTLRCECGREVALDRLPEGGALPGPCGRSVPVPPAEVHAQLNRAIGALGARRRPGARARAVAALVGRLVLAAAVLALAVLALAAALDAL